MPAPKATTHQGNQRSCSKARWRDSASAIARRKGTTEDWDSGRPCGTAAASIMNRSGHSRAPSIRVRKLSPIRTASPFVRSMEQPSKLERSIHTQHHDLIMTQVRPVLRFAPSPTGYLHIGSARTALFNWLYARHTGGKFLLRIEDTDRERSTPEAVAAIFNGLAWMGLDWDEEPIFQYARADRHRAAAYKLVEEGKAYRDFTPKENRAGADVKKDIVDRARANAAEGTDHRRNPFRNLSKDESDARAATGEPFAIRLKVAHEGQTHFDDAVYGPQVREYSEIEDLVLLRSDGHPLYNLSVVLDDIEMGITDVIRGQDHLTNTHKQILLYQAFGAEVPRFAHLPLILAPNKAKLSKRKHGEVVSLTTYRDRGFVPAAFRNFLALLGWSPPEGR